MRSLQPLLYVSVLLVGCSDQPAVTANTVADAGVDAAQRMTEQPPRRPLPDLRFKWVGVAAHIHITQYLIGLSSLLGSGIGYERSSDATISPLQFYLGSSPQVLPPDADAGAPTYVTGDWSFFRFVPDERTEPIAALAQAGTTLLLEKDLKKVQEDHGLITSFDLATAAGSRASYGLTAVRSADGRPVFDAMSTESVSRGELARSVADAAARGLVTTALAGDGTLIRFFAYNRIDDEQRYETDVRVAQLDRLEEQARELAGAGYIITAFGRDGTDLLLVGTRPVGTSSARSIILVRFDSDDIPRDLDAPPVGWLSAPNGKVLVLEL